MLFRRTLLLALAVAAKALPADVRVHAFTEAYNRWATFRNQESTRYSFHAKEPALWLVVKRAWKDFVNDMDRYYGLKR